MRRVTNLLAVLGLVLAMVSIAGAQEKTMTWTGWISDSACGAKGATAAHKDCGVKCVKDKGASYVFVDSKTKTVHKIHNQDAVSTDNFGMEVKVTGHTMEDGSIHVDSVAAAAGM
jgi:hypothetical protein